METPHRSRLLVLLAALLLVPSLLLPWWGVHYSAGGEGALDGVRPFSSHPLTRTPAVIASGVLALAALVLLFVRTAGQSWIHEPRAYVRDLWVATALVAAAVLLVPLWPVSHPFWSVESYAGVHTTGSFRESALPRAGWWLAMAAAGLLGAAARLASRLAKQ